MTHTADVYLASDVFTREPQAISVCNVCGDIDTYGGDNAARNACITADEHTAHVLTYGKRAHRGEFELSSDTFDATIRNYFPAATQADHLGEVVIYTGLRYDPENPDVLIGLEKN